VFHPKIIAYYQRYSSYTNRCSQLKILELV
jgi:hypothetical protein